MRKFLKYCEVKLYGSITFADGSREVAIHIASYIAKKLTSYSNNYFCDFLVFTETDANPDKGYLKLLSRGSLTIPSSGLREFVCSGFCSFILFMFWYYWKIQTSSEDSSRRFVE